MGELLKAVLSEQCLSSRFKTYVVETGLQAVGSVSGITQDLIFVIQDETVFLCQSFGFSIAYILPASSKLRSIMPNNFPITMTMKDQSTQYKYFSGSLVAGSDIPAACFPPSINDRTDASTYYTFGANDQIQVSVNGNFTGTAVTTSVNMAVALYGVEYKFSTEPDLTLLKEYALRYMPPPKDQARAFALDVIGGVQGFTGQRPKINVADAHAQISQINTEMRRVSSVPQTIETGRYARFLRHRINQLKSSVQATNATT